nr:exo 1,3/1,4-beta-D-glucan glucohydrolase [Colwellia echini]
MKYSKKHSLAVIITALIATSLTACDKAKNDISSQVSIQTNTQASTQESHQETAISLQNTPSHNLAIWPAIQSEVIADKSIEIKVKQLLATMTLKQKIAQMIQPEIRDITVEDMRRYGFGSYLNGGGAFPNNNKHSTPQDWIDLAETMYQASIDDSVDGSTIPTMWGTDAVHGHNNVIGATLFPHNIGLGAANNPQLIEKIAQATATEVMTTGIDWVFAPTVATVRDDRWGRAYEGYSEDPEIVKVYAAAVVHGLQGQAGEDFLGDDRVISTVKHFIGDGGTVGGDDQGDNISSEEELYKLHAQGYVGGLTAGAQSVMASFNTWHGKKLHGSQYLLTDVLKGKMGFDGFVVGDWNGHGQIAGCSNENCPQAINAGLDIFMVPTDAWKPLLENTIAQVNQGVIPMSRIDDAVTRILRVKYRAGIFDKPSPANRQFSGKTELIGNEKHREIARQAVRESLVLLKNDNQILPLSPKLNILLAGDAADNIGKQSGGWTITWQGTNNENADFPGGSSIYDGIAAQVKSAGGHVELSEDGNYTKKPDVAVVVYGEEPYAEGNGDRENLLYQRGSKTDLALLKKFKDQGIPVVSVFISGRPMWVNAEMNASDAFVAAWLPGSEGKAVADVLLTNKQGELQYDFTGKLSFSWPNSPDQVVNRFDENYQPLLPYGFGLQYGQTSTVLNNLPETYKLIENKSGPTQIFNGKVEKPWKMYLMANELQTPITSSSQQLPGINYRTIDKVIQEDAFKITLDGTSNAGFRFVTANGFNEDISSVKKDDASLVLTMKIDESVNKLIILSMNCETVSDEAGSCRADIDISKALNNLPKEQWANLSISLDCFVKQGVKFNKIMVPLALHTQSPLTLSMSNAYLAPNANSSSTDNVNIAVECAL